MRARFLMSLILFVACVPARADDWPQFRGPGGAGVSSEAKLPSEWTKDVRRDRRKRPRMNVGPPVGPAPRRVREQCRKVDCAPEP